MTPLTIFFKINGLPLFFKTNLLFQICFFLWFEKNVVQSCYINFFCVHFLKFFLLNCTFDFVDLTPYRIEAVVLR